MQYARNKLYYLLGIIYNLSRIVQLKRQKNILFLQDPYKLQIHKGISEVAHANYWHLKYFENKSSPYSGWQGDGVIYKYNHINSSLNKFILSLKCPVVYIGYYQNHPDHFCVSDSPEKNSEIAASYFLNKGYQNFVYYSYKSKTDAKFISASKNSYEKIINNAGYRIHKVTSENITSWELLQKHLIKKLKSYPKPLAVYALGDDWASDIIDACITAGIKIPEEVAVLGGGNNELMCQSLGIPLSSIDCNFYKIGYEAATMMDSILNGDNIKKEPVIVFPKDTVVTRLSTDSIAVKHLGISKALRFIADNFQSDLKIDDLSAKSALSKTGFHAAFKQHLNRTPGQEILIHRMNHARKLLEETNKTIEAIAIESGFNCPWSLYDAFKKEFKITPNAYRKSKHL